MSEYSEYIDSLSVRDMLPYLSNKELSERIIIYDSLESTNKTAKEMAIYGAEHGTVIITDSQSAGRGRYSRSFFSPPGCGIYMSFIIDTARLSRLVDPTLVTALAAVSVCKAIEKITDKTPQIKWVNDIILDNKKICGILAEAVTNSKSGNIEWIVIGIGINFVEPELGYPIEIKQSAGALFTEVRPEITRNRMIAEVINQIMLSDDQYDIDTLLIEYKKRLITLGKKVLVTEANESYEAIAIDIDDFARLIVKKDDGNLHSLSAGEVSLNRGNNIE